MQKYFNLSKLRFNETRRAIDFIKNPGLSLVHNLLWHFSRGILVIAGADPIVVCFKLGIVDVISYFFTLYTMQILTLRSLFILKILELWR